MSRVIRPIAVDEAVFESSTAPLSVDSDEYGAAWCGEWSSAYAGGYAEGDVVYKGVRLYESLVSGNEDDPETSSAGETPTWLDLGAVNAWRMFDEFVNTKTVGPAVDEETNESNVVVVLNRVQVEDIALFELSAVSVKAELLESDDSVAWSAEVDLYAEVEDVSDWYEYFYGDDTMPRTVATIRLGWVTYDERIRLTITNIGAPAQCGMCIIGRARTLGRTQFGPEVGILDYSVKSTDDFGRTYLAQGPYADRVTAQVAVESVYMDAVHSYLAGIRSLACVWDLNNQLETCGSNFSSLVVYGPYRDFRQVLPGPVETICSLEIQGLI